MKKLSLILIASAFLILCSFTKSYKVTYKYDSGKIEKDTLESILQLSHDDREFSSCQQSSIAIVRGELLYAEAREYN